LIGDPLLQGADAQGLEVMARILRKISLSFAPYTLSPNMLPPTTAILNWFSMKVGMGLGMVI
jgi:hypothetical protein